MRSAPDTRDRRCRRALVALAASLLAACSSSSGGTGTPTPPVDGGDGDGGGTIVEAGARDAASITPRPDLCMGLARGGDVVEEYELPGSAPPAIGGSPVQGSYDLVELDAYAGDGFDAGSDDAGEVPSTRATGRAAQVTLVVGEFSLSTIEARGTSGSQGLGAEQARAVLYRVDGTSLVETAVCPTTALPVPTPFSVISESIILFPDATHRELYKLRR